MERAQLNEAEIEYDVRGSGAPVVFIHGAILSDGFVPVQHGKKSTEPHLAWPIGEEFSLVLCGTNR